MLIDVKLKFENHIRAKFSENEEKRKFILNHERKELVLNNLCKQIVLAERKAILKRKVAPQFYFDRIIESVAEGFAALCLKHRDEAMMSQVEKLKRIHKESKLEDFQNQMDDEVKHIEKKLSQ